MVETVERAPTMDPMAEEEQSSPMKNQIVDEEEEERYNVPAGLPPKPEWDVDSYDGRQYESDPEDSQFFSDEEEYEEYRRESRKAFESKGFIYEPLSRNFPIKDLEALAYDNLTVREVMTNFANLCVKKLNETKGKTVELIDIVRVISRWGPIRTIYITFMARESLSGPLVEYQAKVATYPGTGKPPVPILCRPSLIPSIGCWNDDPKPKSCWYVS